MEVSKLKISGDEGKKCFLYQSMQIRETNVIQDIKIYKNLRDWLTMAAQSWMWNGTKGLPAPWEAEGSSLRIRAHSSAPCESVSGGQRI